MEAKACSCELDDHEISPLYEIRRPKARKLYRCAECREDIAVGCTYVRIKYLADGKWLTTRRCVPCQSIAEDFCCNVFDPGGAAEKVWEHLGVDLRTGEVRDG